MRVGPRMGCRQPVNRPAKGDVRYSVCCLETSLCQPLYLADVIVVDHAYGGGFATKYAIDLDPWMYADEHLKANIGVWCVVQRILGESYVLINRFDLFTE